MTLIFNSSCEIPVRWQSSRDFLPSETGKCLRGGEGPQLCRGAWGAEGVGAELGGRGVALQIQGLTHAQLQRPRAGGLQALGSKFWQVRKFNFFSG